MFLINGRSAQVVRIAERHPQLTLIVDHMGVTADLVKAGKLAGAIDQTPLLAKYPNVSVKLSAAPNYSMESYPFRDFLPHIRRLFDAYGPQRCYWGTDITNGFDRATYRQRVTHFTVRSYRRRTRIASWNAPLSRDSTGPRSNASSTLPQPLPPTRQGGLHRKRCLASVRRRRDKWRVRPGSPRRGSRCSTMLSPSMRKAKCVRMVQPSQHVQSALSLQRGGAVLLSLSDRSLSWFCW
jgi:hypothetical protein